VDEAPEILRELMITVNNVRASARLEVLPT